MPDIASINDLTRAIGGTAPPTNYVHIPHVCIIESPSPRDVLERRREGLALSEALSLAGIRNEYYAVCDKDTIRLAFSQIESLVGSQHLTPAGAAADTLNFIQLYLHFSCHGNEDGIALTAKQSVPWSELRDVLLSLATNLGMFHPELFPIAPFGITMSTCYGLHARKMASPQASPYRFLVGTEKAVTWTDSLIAFITFYNHTIYKGRTLQRAVRSMNDAAMMIDAFRSADPTDAGIDLLRKAVHVALMHCDDGGHIHWHGEGSPTDPDKLQLREKDGFGCDEKGQPLPFFDRAYDAIEFMRQHPNESCQVEHGAAVDIQIYLRQI
jgi:hypothetical protein